MNSNRWFKLLLIPVLFAIACLFAGLYGVVHNQISYTVSPEYFTQFKFYQFGLVERIPPRLGAAFVGWSAAWWMGGVIGMVLIPLGMRLPAKANYFWTMIRSFGVVAITTLAVGIGALVLSFFLINDHNVIAITRYNNDIVDDVAFMRAGMMHNFSYLGGLLGMVTGSVLILKQRKKLVA